MKKSERHRLIRQLIMQQTFSRQEELVSALEVATDEKFTQATISRDVKEMHLVKARISDGTYRYEVSQAGEMLGESRLSRLLRNNIQSMAVQNSMIMLQVVPGSGAVLGNLLDTMAYDDVFGTLSDDAKVMIFMKDGRDGRRFAAKLRDLL
ncbi:ArgR family transcriptional regulator [Periweissella cryptocerci]|uniref:Arginine repressor n=1 Tax=Periweissella cryptocerci TaxID=2506420 RepID=A0A4P6YVI1_9LACO|nr:ArgR family transcriptional regulator [Periweissella cryptocerci]QBO36756.1 ArgR family transcriptional regulator [Periweissella cryptocerci]